MPSAKQLKAVTSEEHSVRDNTFLGLFSVAVLVNVILMALVVKLCKIDGLSIKTAKRRQLRWGRDPPDDSEDDGDDENDVAKMTTTPKK